MDKKETARFLKLSKLFSKPHPWHGISSGVNAPNIIRTFIEIVPGDTMKYEMDKEIGYLKVDRPQRFSNICPFPYGFVPQTYCGETVAGYCMEQSGRTSIKGDKDPLDICVITERNISHGNIILDAKPIGGLRMIDRGEADDKIIAVMKGDALYGGMNDIDDLPQDLTERLTHYFLTYKEMPNHSGDRKCEITDVYGRDEAFEVIKRSQDDYREEFEEGKREMFSLIQQGLEQQ